MPITVSICACSVQPDYLSEGARRSKATASAQGRRRRRRARRPNNTSFFFPAPVLPRPLSRVSPGPSRVRNHHHMFSPRLSLDPTTMFFFSPRRGVFPCLVASRNFCKNSGPFSLPAAGGKRKTGHAPRKKNRPRSSPSGHVAWLLAWSGYTVPAPACETDREGCVSVWLFGDIQERRHVKEETADGGYS